MRATEKITGEKNGEPYRVEDPRPVKDMERAIEKIIKLRESIEADTARILRETEIIAEKKLAKGKLRAEECYRKKCAALERKIEKTEELKKLRDETLLMEKELLSLKKKPPRDSWTEGLDEGEMEGMGEIENLAEDIGPEIVYSKYNAPWSMGSRLVMLGMVYMICAGVPGSVGTTPMREISNCLMNAPKYITAQHPISWKVTEAVGTAAWCTWEELRDPGYQGTWEVCGEVFDYFYMTIAHLSIATIILLGAAWATKRIYPWRALRGIGIAGLILALVVLLPMRMTPAPEVNMVRIPTGQRF
jgi:hypothetical protein